jgi:hypothetical protein
MTQILDHFEEQIKTGTAKVLKLSFIGFLSIINPILLFFIYYESTIINFLLVFMVYIFTILTAMVFLHLLLVGCLKLSIAVLNLSKMKVLAIIFTKIVEKVGFEKLIVMYSVVVFIYLVYIGLNT